MSKQNKTATSDLKEGISVILPTYKGEKWIVKCLDSLANQTLDKAVFEVILIINGEKDNSERLIDNFITIHSDINFKKIILEEAGAANARNAGMDNANRKFSTFIDDDDYISKNYLQGLYDQAEDDTIVIASQIIDVETDGTLNKDNYINTEIQNIIQENDSPSYLELKYTMSINALKLIPTSYLKSNPFNINLKSGEDVVLFTTLAVNYDLNYKILDLQENAIYYRLKREDSVSRQTSSFSFSVEDRLAVIRELNILLKEADNDEAKKFIINKIDAQASFIKQYIDKIIAEDTKEIKEAVEHLDLNYFPDSIFAIDQVNEKYRKATEQIDQYKSRVHYLETYLRTTKNTLEIANPSKEHFEGARASASYRLGHLLIHETRSASDIVRLPWKIKNIKSNNNGQNISSHKLSNSTKKTTAQKLKPDPIKVFKTNKKTGELKIACIMDPFTYGSYAYEANFMQLTPQNWKEEITVFAPDLLFIESAWRGKDELWWNSVGKKCQELIDIVGYCNKNNIPTVFWNKEDPVHFNTFINTSSLFDFVFTSDITMIEKYKSALRHDRVYMLPFACQPKVNNPIEKYDRKDAFCFAGAYYVRYPERTKDLDEFIHHFSALKPIEIYDRNFGKDDVNYMFPDQYKPFIVGTLPFEEIDKAYKGYNFAINLNSVKQSPSMFARRVYEVLASNTITVSNFSKGVRLLFGDLVITSDSGKEIVRKLKTIISNPSYMRNFKLQALRKVLLEHTYRDRLNYVVEKVFDQKPEDNDSLPIVAMVSLIKNSSDLNKVLHRFQLQSYTKKRLYLIVENGIDLSELIDKDIITISKDDQNTINTICTESDFICAITSSDYYGVNYLTDMSLGTLYYDGPVIGKATYYKHVNGQSITLVNDGQQYRPITQMYARRSMIQKKRIGTEILTHWVQNINKLVYTDLNCLSIDEFNYCCDGTLLTENQLREVIDIKDIYQGIKMSDLKKFSEKKNPVNNSLSQKNTTSKKANDKGKQLDYLLIKSRMKRTLSLSPSELIKKLKYRIKEYINPPSINSAHSKIELTDNTPLKSGGDHLLLTNIYPSYYDLYRNGFVHARVKAYQEQGTKVDVFQLRENIETSYDEFENVDVTRGSPDTLRNLLGNNNYKSILIHFLDGNMWDVLKDFIDTTKIFVWIHGAEVQPWHRRKHLFETDKAIEKAKIQSEKRTSFWKKLLSTPHKNLNLIFVSQYLADSVMEDLDLLIPKDNYCIIHNFINTNLFDYKDKDKEQRNKILSIRPYANNNYANDLSVKAILELSEKPYFKDLEFRLIGDGVLFDEILEPLKEFENVIIEKRFLNQKEIADLHKQYGVFLCPSRMDTHGVSRDEAMSSGLIPVTNKVAAIPEFIDETCSILAKENDAHELAEGIAKIYENPELFQKISKAAAERPRSQCNFKQTIGKEIELFNPSFTQSTSLAPLSDKSTDQKKILIFGSCVSRDIFNLENNFHIVNYFARSSFASIFQTPFSHPEVTESLESKFQEKIVKSDMKKSIFSDLKNNNFDILVLDFIDERFNLYSLDNTICTLSNEAVSTGLLEKYPDHKIIKSVSKEFFDMWEEGWGKFIELMKKNGQLDKVLLNKVYWAEETVSGHNFEPTYSKNKIREMNNFLNRLYTIAERSIPPENIMKFSEKIMIGADEHQWGLSPFHYVSNYYEKALVFLENWYTSEKKYSYSKVIEVK